LTTIQKLVAQSKRLLEHGPRTRDSKLSDRYLKEEIIQVTHQLLKLDWYKGKNEGINDVNHLMIATYNDIEVLNDDTRNRDYAVLPAFPMNLPMGMGVQQVKPVTGNRTTDVAFVPLLPMEMEMFQSLLVGEEIMRDQFCYELDRNKIWFTESNNKTLLESDIDTIEIKMLVIDPAQVADTDPYPVPPEMELEILKSVLILHGYNPNEAADMVNNGNPAIR
jgi:hypothetical protein